MTTEQPAQQLRFLSFDRSKTKKARLQCQTCFEDFDTAKELRKHVATFQLEMQQLLARQLEIQAHLPQSTDSGSDEDEDEDEEEDEEYDDEGDCDGTGGVGPVDPLGVGNDQAGYQCPNPQCRRAHPRKRFGALKFLAVHFQKHVRCYEICLFCRDSFTRVRKYIRHRCKRKRQQKDKAKEFYRKERFAQLRKYADQKLDAMLSHQEIRSKGEDVMGTRKREEDGGSEPNRITKKYKGLDGDARPMLHEAISPNNGGPLSSVSGRLNGSATPSGPLSNTGFLVSYPHSTEVPSGWTAGGKVAPIFQDMTIPPFYPSQILSFPSDTLYEGFPGSTPSTGILPALNTGTMTQGGNPDEGLY